MKEVRCAECGAALLRSNKDIERYKRFFCNRICRSLFERVYKDRAAKFASKWERTKARMKEDPLFKAKIAKQMRESLDRRLKDPEYKKRRYAKISETNKKRYHEDKEYNARRREQVRLQKLEKWKKENS